MLRRIGLVFVVLAVLFVSLIFRGNPGQSPGQVIAGFAVLGLAVLILLAIVAVWSWLRRQTSKLLDSNVATQVKEAAPQPQPTLSEILRTINAIVRGDKQ